MRLICPNCDAQYEVDDSAIPVEGRDVQCSNCGHTWFHSLGDPVDPPAEEPAPTYPEPAQAAHKPVQEVADNGAEDDADDAAAPYVPAGYDYDDDDDGPAVTPGAVAAIAATAAPRRRGLDANVAALLREEAEREHEARRADSGTLESQADLGLTMAPDKDRPRRVASAPKDPFADDSDATALRPGRATLPDIEKITSTLNASDERADQMIAEPAKQDSPDVRRGFRLGFGSTVLAGVAVWAVYVFTPQIVAQVPAAEPALTALGDGIDSIRLWLDQIMRQAITLIGGPA